MAPTIVYGPDGKVRLAIGAAGGATIICQVAKALVGVIDWHMSAQDAIAMGLVYAPGKGGTIEQGTELEAMLPQLQALGETLRVAPLGAQGQRHRIRRRPLGRRRRSAQRRRGDGRRRARDADRTAGANGARE